VEARFKASLLYTSTYVVLQKGTTVRTEIRSVAAGDAEEGLRKQHEETYLDWRGH